jgi:putative transposase
MSIAKEQLRQIISENNITTVPDIYAFFKDSFKDMLQELLEAELDTSIGYPKNEKTEADTDNKRNGYATKTVKSQFGEFPVEIPRDRNGEFEPKIIPKYQRDISGIEEKVISLYARGMTTRDIHDQLKDIYGIELSAEMVSKITDRIIPEVREWQSRPLCPIYPFIFMDAIHYKIREDGRILNRAAYVVLGVTLDGSKDILSITIGANESSKFWLGMLNDLKNRGVQDVLFFCIDGLTGFKDAIHATFPQAEVQRCIIHMLRNSFKYVSYKDIKKFASDFKAVYKAPTEDAALAELEQVKEIWGKKYPYAISNWEMNWDVVSPFYQFSEDIRRIMYTTNIIEGLNRQFRKVTKTKSVFTNDTSLEKMLYLASSNVMKKWTQRYRNWDLVLSQLLLIYGERLSQYL